MAREEVSAFEEYDYVVINDEFDTCVDRVRGIVLAERSKLDCMRPKALDILKSFIGVKNLMALIALGVCGGIGAYKSVEVVRGLQKQGHDVVAVMTRSARKFVGPLTFEAITRHRVLTSQFAPGANSDIEHISLASSIDLLLVAPATANVIGKFANGIADDFLTSLYLATKAPVLMAPAMNTHMLEHDAVRRNLETLAGRGVRFVDPGAGYLACGWIGKGRLAEPADIVAAVEQVLTPSGSLSGNTVVVTAGPTREALDPVRFIGNRSSGKMGYALAAGRAQPRRARRAGQRTHRASASSRYRSDSRHDGGGDARRGDRSSVAHADVVIMAAAVADYAPARAADQKIHKTQDTLTLTLVRTPDILDGARSSARWEGTTVACGVCGRDDRRRGGRSTQAA